MISKAGLGSWERDCRLLITVWRHSCCGVLSDICIFRSLLVLAKCFCVASVFMDRWGVVAKSIYDRDCVAGFPEYVSHFV